MKKIKYLLKLLRINTLCKIGFHGDLIMKDEKYIVLDCGCTLFTKKGVEYFNL